MKPRNRYDWLNWAMQGGLMGIGFGVMLFDFILGWYMVIIGAMSIFHWRWRNRTYFEGWMNGRAALIHLQAEVESREEFIEKMIETDIDVMRAYIGDKETKKFLDKYIQHAARSDGSHDAL